MGVVVGDEVWDIGVSVIAVPAGIVFPAKRRLKPEVNNVKRIKEQKTVPIPITVNNKPSAMTPFAASF